MRHLLRWLIVVSIPIVLVVGAVRALTLGWFPAWEYSRPGFPADAYGMETAERLRLAKVSITFLNLPRDLDLLKALRLEDGSVAYNARELQHMDDVKRVYDRITIWAALAAVVAVAAAWSLQRRGETASIWGAISDAGLITLSVLLILGLLMVTAWDIFFTGLHRIFFEGDSWLFRYSDTLIRLFPQRLWQDAGLFIAGAVAALAFVLALVGRIFQRRLIRNAGIEGGAVRRPTTASEETGHS